MVDATECRGQRSDFSSLGSSEADTRRRGLRVGSVISFVAIFNVGAANAATPSDACAMLTAQQLSSALGAVVGPGQPTMPNSTIFCSWSEQGVPTAGARNVSVLLMTTKSFESSKTPLQGLTKTPVSGLGDDAFFTERPGTVSSLSVKKGDSYFQIKTRSNPEWFKTGKTPESDKKDQDVDRALALEILKKL
jgi:hypothetical protein